MPSRGAVRTGQMFSDEAWEAGWAKARQLGVTEGWAPLQRPVTRADVEAIVSAVANHGFEELYVEQSLPDHYVDADTEPGMMDRLRGHMRQALAIEAIRANAVMLTLPREVIDHPQWYVTRIRLIAPVRRLEP